jgi:hypothetical protein
MLVVVRRINELFVVVSQASIASQWIRFGAGQKVGVATTIATTAAGRINWWYARTLADCLVPVTRCQTFARAATRT